MRLNAEIGTAKKANIPGYFVGGKTGTAEKVIDGHYAKNKLFTTFMAVVPADKPRYLFMTRDGRAAGHPGTHGIAPPRPGIPAHVTGKIIERVGPLLGLAPRLDLPTPALPAAGQLGYGFANSPASPGAAERIDAPRASSCPTRLSAALARRWR